MLKKKLKLDGTIDKYKARLVAESYSQKEGFDYFDVYSPITRIITIRIMMALASIHNLVIHQMDVKITFLNGNLGKKFI